MLVVDFFSGLFQLGIQEDCKKAEMYFPVEKKFLFVYGLRILSSFIFDENLKPCGSTRAGVTRSEFKNFDNSKTGLPDQS